MPRPASLRSREAILLHGPRARRWILALVVAGVPLFFLRFTNDPFNVPKLALLIGCLGLVAAVRIVELIQGAPWLGLTRLLVPATALGVPLAVAWAFSPYRYWSLFGHYGRFQGLIPYLVVIVLGILVADAFAEDLRHLAWALTIAGGVAGAYAALQFVGVDPFTWAQQFGGATTRTSTLGNPNFTGGFLAMVLPIAVGLWRSGGPNSARAFQVSLAIGLGLVLSFSQAGYAAAFSAGVVFAGFLLSDRFKPARLVSLIAVVVIGAGIVAAVGYSMLNPNSDLVPATTAQRALWWRGAMSMVAHHPLVGRGPNAYAVEGNRYRPPEDAAVHGLDYSDDTHSVPLALATGAGALGLVGYVTVLGWGSWKARDIHGDQILLVGFVAALAAYFIQSLVSIDELALRTTLWAVLGGMAASFFVPLQSKERGNRGIKTKRKTRREDPRLLPLVGLVALVGLVVVWWSASFILNDARVRWASASFADDEPEEGREDFRRALGFRADYHYRHLYGFRAGETALEHEARSEEWLDEARGAYSFLQEFPHVPALVDYARLLSGYSELDPSLRDEAADSYLRLTRLDPNNLQLLREAADALAELGRQEPVNLLRERIGRLEDLAGN